MKNTLITIALALFSIVAFSQEKISTKNGHIKFFSTTPIEDIESNNYKVASSITPETGLVVVSVPMQGFQFEKSLMQKHYNSKKFLNTKKYPKAKFKGTITNLSEILWEKEGTYKANVVGELTMHGVTKPLEEILTFVIVAGEVMATAEFELRLADYNIVFKKGKPSTNIAKVVTVTLVFDLI